MNVFEIIGGSILLIACVILIILVMLQESKDNGAQSITGGVSDSYLGKNSGRTLDAILGKITKYAAIAFFVLTLLVSVFTVYLGK